MNVQKHLSRYFEYCEYRKDLDAKTLKAYRIDLRQYFEQVGKDELKKDQIEQYISDLHKKYKQKTIKRKIASVKAYYNYLEEEELIRVNPFHKIKVKFREDVKLPRIIPRDEIEQLLNYMYQNKPCKESTKKYWLRDIAVIEILFSVGVRVYEISNIKTENVNLNTGAICIMGKGGKERYIQIGEKTVLNLLKEYCKANEQKINQSGFFFANNRGERLTEQSIRLMIKKYTKLAGIKRNITPHMFRHSFATYLIEEGVDISCVQHILGHSSIKTTQIYIHVAIKKQAEILETLHPRRHMKIDQVA